MRKKVLLLAKTGFIIRDLLLGKFTDEIIKQYELAVAVPHPNDKDLVVFAQNKPITYIPFVIEKNPTGYFEQYFSIQHLMYRLKQVERDNTSMQINTILLKPFYTRKQKVVVRSFLSGGRIIKQLRLGNTFEDAFLLWVSRSAITQHWVRVLKTVRPDFIVSTMLTLPNGLFAFSPDLPVVLAARELNIPVGSLVQSWDNLSSKAYVLPPWLQRYWTWSDAMTRDLVKFVPRVSLTQIKTVGSPHYDFHQDKSLIEPRELYVQRLGLNPQKPYTVIGTGTNVMFPDAPEIVLKLVKGLISEMPDMQILVRIHPKDDFTRWENRKNEIEMLGAVFQNTTPSIPMDLGGFASPRYFFFEQVNTLTHASVIINASSSLSVDAAILNRPIITLCYDITSDARFPQGRAIAYNYSEHFKTLIEAGGIYPVFSDKECVDAVKMYLRDPSLHHEQRLHVAHLIGGPLDGYAGVRMAQDIGKLLMGQ